MNKRKKQKTVVLIITIIFILLVLTYLVAILEGVLSLNSTTGLMELLISGITVLILGSIIAAMIVIAMGRQKEIDEEDKDDLSQY